MRVGERTDYNRLIIEVETDGSITPSEALHKTANILKDHFDKFSALEIIKTVVAPLKISKEVKKKGGQGSRKKKAK